MVPQSSLLVALVDLIELVPSPPVKGPSTSRGGRPPVYSERLFLKALVIMLVRNVSTVSGLIAVLEQPTWEMQALRARLTEHGCFPSRRTWERRLATLPDPDAVFGDREARHATAERVRREHSFAARAEHLVALAHEARRDREAR